MSARGCVEESSPYTFSEWASVSRISSELYPPLTAPRPSILTISSCCSFWSMELRTLQTEWAQLSVRVASWSRGSWSSLCHFYCVPFSLWSLRIFPFTAPRVFKSECQWTSEPFPQLQIGFVLASYPGVERSRHHSWECKCLGCGLLEAVLGCISYDVAHALVSPAFGLDYVGFLSLASLSLSVHSLPYSRMESVEILTC